MTYLNMKLKSRLNIYKPIGYQTVLYEFNETMHSKDMYHFKPIQ